MKSIDRHHTMNYLSIPMARSERQSWQGYIGEDGKFVVDMNRAHLRPPSAKFGLFAIFSIIVVCTAIEGLLQASDRGLLPLFGLRNFLYLNGAFWPQLLNTWQPQFQAQPVVMFLTYGFLHGGLLHFGMNMITLYSLGKYVLEGIGTWRFLAVYFGSSFTGAGVFLLLTTSDRPMVGASGALFGLAGAIAYEQIAAAETQREAVLGFSKIAAVLVGLNVILYIALSGQVAWQTHLGGSIGGFLLTWLLMRSQKFGP